MMTTAIPISRQTMRRYILGQQGLWPGRRWSGFNGVVTALTECGSVQIDPVQVVARAHDLILASRVEGYHPDDLYQAAYGHRLAFDYGETLFMYPIAALPYLRMVMARTAGKEYVASFLREHAQVCEVVRAQLSAQGPLGHRDFDGNRITSYRARKDTGLALHRLWLTGELMTHSRRGFDRLFDFADRLFPDQRGVSVSEDDARAFFTRQVFREMGLVTTREWAVRYSVMTHLTMKTREAKVHLDRLVEQGEVVRLQVEGQKGDVYALSSALPDLNVLEAGQYPVQWQPVGMTTDEEVTFLAPLEMVSARGRARTVFGFDYKWEIYTPQEKRVYGYYTLPVLYGDRLVARIDPRLDRKTRLLIINGLWFEPGISVRDGDLVQALAKGLVRFVRFHNATAIHLDAIEPVMLRRQLTKFTTAAL
jgi:uncharacterized protein YcaQ